MSTSTQSDPTVWEHYNQQAKIEDIDLRKDWDTSMDVLLIFAALFSAILTAFVVDTYHKLELGDTQILLAISAQLADPRKEPISAEAFTPDPKDVVVNVMFFSSLGCSLITAMGAMLVKQWMRNYARGLEEMDEPRRRALARHRRFVETLRWRLPDLVALLPVIMQLALGLFFAGLGILLFHNTVIFGVIISLSGLGATFLFITALISTLFPNAPFRTPVSRFARWVIVALDKFFRALVPRFTRWLSVALTSARPADHSVRDAEKTGGARNNASRPADDLIRGTGGAGGTGGSALPNKLKVDWEALEWLAKRTSPTPENSRRVYAIITATGESHGRWKDMKGNRHWETFVDYVLDPPPGASQDRSRPLRALFLAFVGIDLDEKAKDLLERTRSVISRPGSSVDDCWLMYRYRSLSSARYHGSASEPPREVVGTSPVKGLQHLREQVASLFPVPFFNRSDLDNLLREYFVTPGSDGILRTIVTSEPITQADWLKFALYIMRTWPNKKSPKVQGAFHRGLLHFLLATAWSDSPRISSLEPSSGDADPEPFSIVLARSPSGPAGARPAPPQAKTLDHDYLIALQACTTRLGIIKRDHRADLLHALASAMMRCAEQDIDLIFRIFQLLKPETKYGSDRVVEMLIAAINSWEGEFYSRCYTISMLATYARRCKQILTAKEHAQYLEKDISRATICLLLDIPFKELHVLTDVPGINDEFWQAPELMLEMNRRFDEMEGSAGKLSFELHDSLFLHAALLHPSMSTNFHHKALRCLARVAQQQQQQQGPEGIPIKKIMSTMAIDKWLGAGDSLSSLMVIAGSGAATSVFLQVCMAWNWEGLNGSFPRNAALKWVSDLAGIPISIITSEINDILDAPMFQLETAFDAVMVSTIFLKLKLERKNANAIKNSTILGHLKTVRSGDESEDSANLEALAIMSARKWLRDRTALDGAGIREAWEWIEEIARKGLVLERDFQNLWISPVLRNILPKPTSDIEGLEPLISATIKADTGLARALISRDGLAWLRNISQEERHREWSADTLKWIVEHERSQLQPQDAEELIALVEELRRESLSPATENHTSVLRRHAANIQETTDEEGPETRPLSNLERFAAITKFDKLIARFSQPAREASLA